MIVRSRHSQPSEDRRRLEKCKPSISSRQTNHCQYLEHAKKLARNNARVLHVLRYQRQRRQEEAYKVCLDKRSLDLSLVDLSRPPYNESLCQYQAAVRTKDGTRDAEFSFGFGGKEYRRGRGEEKTQRPDQQRGGSMDGKQRVEPSFGGQVILECIVAHCNDVRKANVA